jgi:hypothetical protein
MRNVLSNTFGKLTFFKSATCTVMLIAQPHRQEANLLS